MISISLLKRSGLRTLLFGMIFIALNCFVPLSFAFTTYPYVP